MQLFYYRLLSNSDELNYLSRLVFVCIMLCNFRFLILLQVHYSISNAEMRTILVSSYSFIFRATESPIMSPNCNLVYNVWSCSHNLFSSMYFAIQSSPESTNINCISTQALSQMIKARLVRLHESLRFHFCHKFSSHSVHF